jgi:hypothetical protein
MQETSCQNEAYIADLLERARKLREAGERLIQEADSLWMLARTARHANEDKGATPLPPEQVP